MDKLSIKTTKRSQMIDITRDVQNVVTNNNIVDGIITVFIPHTTAAVTINENADPAVCRDFMQKINKMVPEGEGFYTHAEGNSDSHLKASMIGFSETIIVENGTLKLGTWQGIYFCEFDGARTRTAWVKCQA